MCAEDIQKNQAIRGFYIYGITTVCFIIFFVVIIYSIIISKQKESDFAKIISAFIYGILASRVIPSLTKEFWKDAKFLLRPWFQKHNFVD